MQGQQTRWGVTLLMLVLAAGTLGCNSSQKKLTGDDGGALDGILYGALGMDRDSAYYYRLVRDSHDKEKFTYRPSADKYIVDKNVDAVQRLGQASFARLEGQAQVVTLLIDVLLEDRSALAQTNAANSLTRMGVKLPQYRARNVAERGDRFLALLQEMDGIWQPGGTAARAPGQARQRTVQILNQMAAFEMATIAMARETLKPFYSRESLLDATDPAVRTAADTALTRRMAEAIRLALRAGVDANEPHVREESVRGLKTLGDHGAIDAVLARLEVESNWRVRSEMLEFLGRLGGQESVAALLPMLEAGDPTLRHAARRSLTQIAGRDLGFRRATWNRWAYNRYPVLGAQAAEAAAEAAEEEAEKRAAREGRGGPGAP